MAPSSKEDRLKPLVLTDHARAKIAERGLALTWIETVARHPLWTTPEPNDPELERRFAPVPEFGNRILRVVCKETERELRIVTATFDRRARRPT